MIDALAYGALLVFVWSLLLDWEAYRTQSRLEEARRQRAQTRKDREAAYAATGATDGD